MRRNEEADTPGRSRARGSSRAFDAFALVQQRATIKGRIEAADLPRIADRLAAQGGRIEYTIAGRADEAGRPALDVGIDGELWLACQRCLQPMAWPAQQRITVLLARDRRELALLDDTDEREVVLADAPLDPLELIEDELLLTMPYAPRHVEGEGTLCVPTNAGDASAGKARSPFDALTGLKSPRAASAKRPKR
jgi:uncharacterized protein